MSPPKDTSIASVLDNIYVVLSEPKGPLNVGSTARAMNNAGIRDLALVNPCEFTGEDARKMASGCNDTLLGARVFGTTAEALAEASYVVGLTCRAGKYRTNLMRPDEMASKIIPLAKNNKIALLFGTEKSGLSNEDVALCDTLVTIPTSPLNPSLNLSQAVLLVCYEIFKASDSADIYEQPYKVLATSEAKEQMFEHMEDVFGRIGYLNPQNPGHIMMVVRSIFGRTELEDRDVRVLRGMVGKIDCYAKWIARGKGKRKGNRDDDDSESI